MTAEEFKQLVDRLSITTDTKDTGCLQQYSVVSLYEMGEAVREHDPELARVIFETGAAFSRVFGEAQRVKKRLGA